MEKTLTAVIGLYRFDNHVFQRAASQLNEYDANRRLVKELPPINWIAGHVTMERCHVLNLLGIEADFDGRPLYEKGYDGDLKYPSFAVICQAWEQHASTLPDHAANVSTELLEKDLPYTVPHGDNTLRGALLFFTYHEAWHFGQISSLGRILGLKGLAD